MKYLSSFLLTLLLIVTGCGVPQEEHDAAVAKLPSERADIESSLNDKISDLESIVKAEKAKGKSLRLQLDSTERKLKDGQKKALVAAKEAAKIKSQVTSLERDVNRAESEKSRVEEELADMEEQLSAIEIERDEAINDLEQLRNNMSALSEPKPDPISQSPNEASPSSEPLPSYSESELEFLPPSERARIMLEQMRSK